MTRRSAERRRREKLVGTELLTTTMTMTTMMMMMMMMKKMKQKQPEKERRESEIQKTKTRMMMTRMTIKSEMKRRAYRVTDPLPPHFPNNLHLKHPPSSSSSHQPPSLLHVSPPALSSFCGAKLYRTGGQSGAVPPHTHTPFPMDPRAKPPTHRFPPHLTQPKAPRFSGSPPLSIPQFHCQSPFMCSFMYSRVRTLGLVSSFWVCAFNILLDEFEFLSLGLLFLLFCVFVFCSFSPSVPYFSRPNKIIAIATVQQASHDFSSWPPVARIKVVATFLLSV